MKNLIAFTIVMLLLLPTGTYAQQTQTGTSASISLNIKKVKLPPILTVKDIRFTDADGNNRIDGRETCQVSFTIENSGRGAAVNLKMDVQEKSGISGLRFNRDKTLPIINPGGKLQVQIPVEANAEIANGQAQFFVSFEEALGFPPDPFEMKIETKAFQSPDVKIVDHQFLADNGYIKLGRPIQLKTLVQNVGQGDAKNIKIRFAYPDNVYPNGEESFEITDLKAGESRELVFEFLPNKLYSGNTIPINVKTSESWGKYGSNPD